MQNVTAPPFFLTSPGEPNLKWEKWKRVFERYARVCGVSLSAERKTSLLLHCLGSEGQDVFDHLPDLSDAEEKDLNELEICLKKLDKHYLPRVSTILERYNFGKGIQNEGESVEGYVTRLRKLASSCKFGELCEERIRDQFMLGCTSEKIREELWIRDEPSLDEVLQVAKRVEHTLVCVDTLKKDKQDSSIQLVKDSDKKDKVLSKTIQGYKSKKKDFVPKCFRCDKTGHFANDSKCPALNVICLKCKKKGHLSVVCRTKGVVTDVKNVEINEEDFVCGQIVIQVDSNLESKSCPLDFIQVEGESTKVLFDSGAKITIISRVFFEQKLSHRIALMKPDIRPFAYGGEPISIMGYFTGLIQYKDRSFSGKVYVSHRGDSILSWFHQRDLGVMLDPSNPNPIVLKEKVSNVSVGYDNLLEQRIKDRFSRLFRKKLGCLKGFKLKIELRHNFVPSCSKVRNVPLALRNEMKKELQKLLEGGIIEEVAGTDWVAPVVAARKPDGSLRLCIDLRQLNKWVVVDQYPLPNITELLTLLSGAMVFSTIDLASAYHQIELDELSRSYTSFITPFGTFRFIRMPFGLVSAAAVFQRVMERTLEGCEGICIYQDDILVFGRDTVEHEQRLTAVLEKLQDANLTIKLEKCKFGVEAIHYLGHTVTGKGIAPKEKLVETISKMPPPCSKEELMKFFGMVEYYNKFVDGFAALSVNMRSLLKKGTDFKWDSECNDEFLCIKEKLRNAPCLASFDPLKTSVLTTDASLKGLGAVLQQESEKGLITIMFASRGLKEPETRYSVIEREALAVFWAVRKLKKFLWGTKFLVKTDHKPLCETFTKKGIDLVSSRITKWVIALQEYNFEIRYIPGVENCVADTLSRLVTSDQEDESCDEWDDSNIHVCHVHDQIVSEEEWKKKLNEDKTLYDIMALICKGWHSKKDGGGESLKFWSIKDELAVQDGLLFRGTKLIPPTELRNILLELAHESHAGMQKTKERLRSSYWWPGMDIQVERLVRDCGICAGSAKSKCVRIQPMVVRDLPKGPWTDVAFDIVGPIHSNGQQIFILVLLDLFSRWPEILFTTNIETSTVIKFLESLIAREGFPKSILTDNGVQLVSREMELFLRNRGIVHKKCSLYHPETNGAIERFNKVLKETIAWAKSAGLKWKDEVCKKVENYSYPTHLHWDVSILSFQR